MKSKLLWARMNVSIYQGVWMKKKAQERIKSEPPNGNPSQNEDDYFVIGTPLSAASTADCRSMWKNGVSWGSIGSRSADLDLNCSGPPSTSSPFE